MQMIFSGSTKAKILSTSLIIRLFDTFEDSIYFLYTLVIKEALMNLKNLLLISVTVLFVAIIFEIFLFLSGSKVLTEELEVLPGEYLEADNFKQVFGNQIEVNDPVLLCEYFNGRKLVYRKYKHSPLNEGGKDACPSFLRPRQ